MCTVKIQFEPWVAMETPRFHIAQMIVFPEGITQLVVQSGQFGSHEKLSWGFMVG